jgi:hypothetical protein
MLDTKRRKEIEDIFKSRLEEMENSPDDFGELQYIMCFISPNDFDDCIKLDVNTDGPNTLEAIGGILNFLSSLNPNVFCWLAPKISMILKELYDDAKSKSIPLEIKIN